MSNRVTDLTFLRNFAKDDQAVYEKFIRIFLTDSTSLMKDLQQKIASEDWRGIEAISHTLRSQFNFMGVKEGEELLKAIKENASSQKSIADAKSKMESLSLLFTDASKELEEELNFLKNSKIGF